MTTWLLALLHRQFWFGDVFASGAFINLFFKIVNYDISAFEFFACGAADVTFRKFFFEVVHDGTDCFGFQSLVADFARGTASPAAAPVWTLVT